MTTRVLVSMSYPCPRWMLVAMVLMREMPMVRPAWKRPCSAGVLAPPVLRPGFVGADAKPKGRGPEKKIPSDGWGAAGAAPRLMKRPATGVTFRPWRG